MNQAMIYPYKNSEKAISNYSSTLANSLGIKSIQYTAGKPFEVFKIIKELKKYDLIHFQHEYNLLGGYSLPIFLLYTSLLFSCKNVVTTMHTVLSKNEKFNKGNKLKTFLRRVLYTTQNKLIGITSNKVIVHTNFFKDILVYNYGLKENEVEVIPQAIKEDIPKYNKEELKKEFNLKGNVYLIIGSFIPDHGADIILKQAEKIKGTILVVANNKSVNDRNDTRIKDWLKYNKRLTKSKNIQFHIKHLPYDLWWKYFTMADLVLLPYRQGIGSGIFADAIATKTPMVCSNIPFFRDVKYDFIRIAKTDKDFPTEIHKAMNNYPIMIKSFDSYINKYSVSKIVNRYKKLYAEI